MLQAPRRRQAVVAALALALTAGSLTTLGPSVGNASSHREAPLIAGEPRLDNTDVYAFVSPDKPDTVTLLANFIPFEEPNGGPNFYAFATNTAYDINIDSNGDARPDVIYRWVFDDHFRDKNTFLYNTGVVTSVNDKDLNFFQTFSLLRWDYRGWKTLTRDAPVAPSFTGKASFPNYSQVADDAITKLDGNRQVFAGQADDPFFADLRVFDLLYGANLSEVGQDTLAGYNVNTLALQVPQYDLALKGDPKRNPVVGIWSTTSRARVDIAEQDGRRSRDGGWVQVSRLGNPLVNEVVIPVGKKDEFNATQPKDDAKFLKFVQDPEVPKLVESIFWIPAPKGPRNDLVEVFLTGVAKATGLPIAVDLNSQLLNQDVYKNQFVPSEELRLNMSIPPTKSPNRLGVVGGDVQGFPNGRRLTDDVIDITLQAAEGVLLADHAKAIEGLGDAVDKNNVGFKDVFPYIGLPNEDAVNQLNQPKS
jgi:hypothetical protein